MTVPVSESSEERNLRRLVDAINANANLDAISKTARDGGDRSPKRINSSGGSSIASSGKPGRLPPGRSPGGKSPTGFSKPAPVQAVQRSPPRKVSRPDNQG